MEKVVDLEKTNQQLIENGIQAFFEGANQVLSDLKETVKALDEEVIFNELTTSRVLNTTRTSNLTKSTSETTNKKD